MTARNIINEVLNNSIDLPSKIVYDAVGKAEAAAADRVNGKIDNNGYKQKIEEIRKNIKDEEKKALLINQLKNKQKVNTQGAQVGSDSVGAGVSTPVQNKV